MTTLAQRLADLALRIATDAKSLRTMINGNLADLSSLTTTTKTSLVAALNELKTNFDTEASARAALINDAALTTSTSETYSVAKIRDYVTTALANLVNGAPSALDTLKELADAIGDDASFAATITASLGNRVRVDAAQGLTTPQKAQARTNIDAYGSVELGDPNTDLVAVFNAGLI